MKPDKFSRASEEKFSGNANEK